MNRMKRELRTMLLTDLDFTERKVWMEVKNIRMIANMSAEDIRDKMPEAYLHLCIAIEMRTAILSQKDILETIDNLDID